MPGRRSSSCHRSERSAWSSPTPAGSGKTQLAALAQQHYGAGMDGLHLPAGWHSTANALEVMAFHAKDALLVVDDFAPTGSAVDIQRLHREADRLIRGQGNNA